MSMTGKMINAISITGIEIKGGIVLDVYTEAVPGRFNEYGGVENSIVVTRYLVAESYNKLENETVILEEPINGSRLRVIKGVLTRCHVVKPSDIKEIISNVKFTTVFNG